MKAMMLRRSLSGIHGLKSFIDISVNGTPKMSFGPIITPERATITQRSVITHMSLAISTAELPTPTIHTRLPLKDSGVR